MANWCIDLRRYDSTRLFFPLLKQMNPLLCWWKWCTYNSGQFSNRWWILALVCSYPSCTIYFHLQWFVPILLAALFNWALSSLVLFSPTFNLNQRWNYEFRQWIASWTMVKQGLEACGAAEKRDTCCYIDGEVHQGCWSDISAQFVSS